MKVSKDLLEVSAQGDGGRWGLGELCRSLKVSPSRAGLGGLGCPLGSGELLAQLMLGAGWILEHPHPLLMLG